MALADYVGRAPPEGADGTRIDRVTAHRVWNLESETTATCANCGTGLSLGERHLLVRLVSRSATADLDRRYLCDETCVAEWVGETSPT
ncbi:MAG: hypothetical protein A07HB70_00024 [uncultured archaeon A07HB70]|nr:MAG: hypothetical protein A07HB70_00024 [uncultured archaeon A07HB70]